jgi:lipid A disaccharide synthetase
MAHSCTGTLMLQESAADSTCCWTQCLLPYGCMRTAQALRHLPQQLTHDHRSVMLDTFAATGMQQVAQLIRCRPCRSSHRRFPDAPPTPPLPAASPQVDYALCLHPFEPALLQSEHCGAAFTGHHLVRPIIRAAREAGVWMHTYLQQQPDLLTVRSSGQEVEAFCRKHGLPYKPRSSSSGAVQVQQAGHTQRGADFLGAASLHASASASSSSSAGGEAAGGSAAGVVRDPVVCLLPGQHEMDLKQLVPLYDAALRQLDQKHSNLRAVLLSTPFWHNSLKEVAASFGVPTTVVDLHSEGQLALEACDVAISHAGPASLHCAVAGVPMVAVSPVNAVWDFWPMVKLSMGKSGMQHASLPNLLLGSGAVPEVMMMMPAAAASKLCGELDQLLRQADLRRRQQQALQQVVLAMVPPSTAGQLLMPEEVAASLVLDVIRQHAEDQRRAAAA